jgi:hypothetical protein
MAEDYIAQNHTWATSQIITATRLNNNVSDITDGLSGGSKAVNIGKLLMNGTTTIDSSRNATLAATTATKITMSGFIVRDLDAGLTASTTQTQGQGALTADVNEISTCANAGDTVTLPTAAAGQRIMVINNGANRCKIFPASGDDLGNGADTEGELAAGDRVIFTAIDATTWYADSPIQTISLNIGDWNMDSTSSVNVAHGLDYTKIVEVNAFIRDDAGTTYNMLSHNKTTALITDGSIALVNSTNVNLERKVSGPYDNSSYDSTSYNRGFVTIKYVL